VAGEVGGFFANAAAHEALDGRDGVLVIEGADAAGGGADERGAVGGKVDDGGGEARAVTIGKEDGEAGFHYADERVGGAQVDADDHWGEIMNDE
jgi:hypothetical protein